MAHQTVPASSETWLRNYYFLRGVVSIAWIAAAVAIGRTNPGVAAVLLVAYPAWDALANFLDAQRSGGLGRSPSQTFNMVVSGATAIAIGVVVTHSMSTVFTILGAWAALAGILQLVTAVRRWKSAGAEWAMILSGAQSTLGGAFFVKMSFDPVAPKIGALVGYAAFGAFYFLLSALLLTISARRRSLPANA
jgi:uncharacterized membrane protein HdeD (DUF308 family)